MKWSNPELDAEISEGLPPCPFCGSSNVSLSYSLSASRDELNGRFVECEDCAACGPQDDACDRHEAARLWSRRAA